MEIVRKSDYLLPTTTAYYQNVQPSSGRNHFCYSDSALGTEKCAKAHRPALVHHAKSFDGDDGGLSVDLFVLQTYSLRSSTKKTLILEPLNQKNSRPRRAFREETFFFKK